LAGTREKDHPLRFRLVFRVGRPIGNRPQDAILPHIKRSCG